MDIILTDSSVGFDGDAEATETPGGISMSFSFFRKPAIVSWALGMMAIFWILAVLTVVEIAVVFMPFGKIVNGTMLCVLAVTKAALVAAYFMHLKFDNPLLTKVFYSGLFLAVGVYLIALTTLHVFA